MPELSEQARGWLSELRSTFERQRGDYAWAELVGGYSTSEPTPVLAHLVIRFHPSEQAPQRSKSEYPHFVLLSEAVDPQVGWNLFEALLKEEEVTLGEYSPPVRFRSCHLDQPTRHYSMSYPFDEEWPTEVGLLNGTRDGRLRHELLASPGGPLYTGPQEAINEKTRVPVGWRGFAPTVYLLMPDRRARIRSPRISTSGVSGEVDRGPVSSTGLVLKGYASPVASSVRDRERLSALLPPKRIEIDEPNGAFVFETDFFPNHLILVLIEKGSGVVLDHREYEATRMMLPNDISFEADAAHIGDLIHAGESERVEFKEGFDGGEGWLKSVCAFSNGEGGTIFFGVKDDGSIVGVQDPKSPDWVAQKIRAVVEPFPSYRFATAEIGGKVVAYVDVNSGPEKPYHVRDQGVYIRAKATTRQATRHEVLLLAKVALGVN